MRSKKKLFEVYPKHWIGFGVDIQFYRSVFCPLVPTITVDFWAWTFVLFPMFPTELCETEFSPEPEQEMTISYRRNRLFGTWPAE